MDITSEARTELTPEAERRVFRLTIVVVLALLVILTAVTIAIWPRDGRRLLWPVNDPIVMWVPFAILQWAFTGGMVSVLYRLVTRRGLPAGRLELYGWAIAKPIIGLFMGSLVYFLALAAAKLVDGSLNAPRAADGSFDWTKGPLWLNVVAFVGGFSDELSIGLIHRFVRHRLGDDEPREKKRLADDEPKAKNAGLPRD